MFWNKLCTYLGNCDENIWNVKKLLKDDGENFGEIVRFLDKIIAMNFKCNLKNL